MIHRPRLSRAVQMASSFLAEHGVTKLPVRPKELIRQCGWSVKKYSSVVAQSPDVATLAELIETLASQDAVSLHTDARVIIVYNDAVTSRDRIRFSLCHEIGHLILEHFLAFDLDALSPEEKAILETEANVFAANLLAPIGVVDLLQRPFREVYRHIFGMSKQSWEMRMKTLSADRSRAGIEVIRQQQAQFHDFMYSRICAKCGEEFISAQQHCCPACSCSTLRWKHATPPPMKSLPAPAEPRECPIFPWTPADWHIMFPQVSERPEEPRALFCSLFEENPMVLDALWETPTPKRRSSHGKHRSPSPHC